MGDPELFSLVHNLLETQRAAALATQEMGQPYLSLMAFAVTPDLKTIILATDRYTRKYANLMVEPRLALLIDNRGNTPADTRGGGGYLAGGGPGGPARGPGGIPCPFCG